MIDFHAGLARLTRNALTIRPNAITTAMKTGRKLMPAFYERRPFPGAGAPAKAVSRSTNARPRQARTLRLR